MAIDRRAAFSRGDVIRRIQDLEDWKNKVETARTLEHSSYASGGIRTRGGRILAEDASAEKVFEVTTEPPDIFMRAELIAEVARQIIGESVLFDINVFGGNRTALNAFGDLEFAGSPSLGPAASFELTGTAFLAIWGCRINLNTLVSTGEDAEGWMDLDVTGPSPFSPSFTSSVTLGTSNNSDFRQTMSASVARARKFDGLTPGSYQVEAKYSTDSLTEELDDVRWIHCWLVVIRF